jgi:co-chaperonin GroES (HSP10)
MYQTIWDAVIIRAEKDKNAKVKVGDAVIDIVTKFDPWGHATTDGVVVSAPVKLSKGGQVKVKSGDKVYCHHFLTSEQNEVEINGEVLYRMDHREIYCTVNDGKIDMIGEWNFCSALREEEVGFEYSEDAETGTVMKKTASGIILDTDVKHDTKWAVIRHLSKDAIEEGLNEGDHVLYRKDCDYEMTVEGVKYFRIRTKDILAKRDGRK